MPLTRLATPIRLLALLAPAVAYAGNPIEGTPITVGNIKTLVENIAQTFMTIAALIVVIFIVYGGTLMAMSGGDTTRFGKGKGIVINALIGGAVIFGVGVIIATIAGFAQNPNSIFGGGSEVQQLQVQNRNFNQLAP